MSERTVKVRCEELCKRMQLTLQTFDVFKETVRTRFNLDTEEMSIKAKLDGDEDEYDITNDDDLQDVWSALKELRITPNQSERLKLKIVEINGHQYRIDGPMAADSPIVQGYTDAFYLDDFINLTKAMTEAMGLSYIASLEIGNSRFINAMTDICLSTRRVCNNTRSLMSGYERTCSHVIDAFQRMILYVNENNGKSALASFATVGEFIHQSREDTERLIGEIDETLKQMEQFASKIAGAEDAIKKELQGIEKEMNKSIVERARAEKELTEIEKTIGEDYMRVCEREIQAKEADKSTTTAAIASTTGLVGSGAAVGTAGVVGIATAEGAAITAGVAGVLVAAPIFLLLALGGGVAFGAYKLKEMYAENEKQKTCKQIRLKRRQKIKVEMKQIELDARQKELGHEIDPAKKLCHSLRVTRNNISCVRDGLTDLQSGWKDMGGICEAMNRKQEMIQNLNEKDCSKILKSTPFRMQVVQYYARWVALQAFARRCNESLQASQRQFEYRTSVDFTRNQAREYLQQDDVLYLMAPE